jgi:hypothetical protein
MDDKYFIGGPLDQSEIKESFTLKIEENKDALKYDDLLKICEHLKKENQKL